LPGALLLMTPNDQRVFFVMPWQGKTLVGTTDQADDGQVNSPRVTEAEARYLLDALNTYTTRRRWEMSDIVSAFAGYRPLISTPQNQPSLQTREESYRWLSPGVLSVSGGKYTTYRLMAERAVNQLETHSFANRTLTRCSTLNLSFLGCMTEQDTPSDSQLSQLSKQTGVSRESLLHLIYTYGRQYHQILNVISTHPKTAAQFDTALPMVIAELAYAIRHEWVKTFDDFMRRRTLYGLLHCDNRAFLDSVARQFNQLTGQLIDVDQQVNDMVAHLSVHA
jgi:glycerol-3-phosphate dehydrogenase